jgi:hypothetical protein
MYYWAGFKAKPHPGQYKSQAGFFIFIFLALFSSYFALRELSTIDDLAGIIDLVPNITDVSYIPSKSEVATISSSVSAAIPPHKNEKHQQLDDSLSQRKTDYWLVKSTLSANTVIEFYQHNAQNKGWILEKETLPWMMFSRGMDKLSIYISDDNAGTGSKVLYAAELSGL